MGAVAAAMLLRVLCASQDDLPPSQEKIDEALDRAALWLRAQAGSLPSDVPINRGMGHSFHALALYALHHAGMDPQDDQFRRLCDSVASQPIRTTYVAACTAMALEAIDRRRHRRKIGECAQFLVDNQCENGQWSYGKAYDIPELEIPAEDAGSTQATVVIRSRNPVGPKTGDNSNSQYAALGLFACGKAGFEFEKPMLDRAIAWWETTQKSDGSWHYADQGSTKASDGGFGSMTAGGGSSVIMLRRVKGQRVDSTKARRAISWLGEMFSVSENPRAPEDRQRFHYYYLYALERIGDLYPMQRMGRHDWYAEGARWLLSQQREDGSWGGTYTGMDVADTCFAILFLRRATKVATGK